MIKNHQKTFVAAMLSAIIPLGFAWGSNAQASAYPERPIHMSVGFGPGSGPDMLARLLGEGLRQELGVPVVVENRPGAGGAIAMQYLRRQAPDGYSIGLGALGQTILGPLVQPSVGFDILQDFEPIAQVGAIDLVLALPATTETLEAFSVQLQGPQGLFMGTMGAGTISHLGIQALTDVLGGTAEPVHFKSAADATSAVVNNEVQAMLMSPSMANPLVSAGRLVPVAATGSARSSLLPDVPTFQEQGIDFEMVAWFGLFAPKDTPSEILDALAKAALKAVDDADLRERLIAAGIGTEVKDRQAFATFVPQEAERWKTIIESSN